MSKKVHLICNAHIDPIWQWDWQEGVSAVLSTFYSAVKLAEKYDYIFCHNEVTVYKYVETYAPELFREIQRLVKEGKWRIIGGWYLQPDDNMPMGESFVRQIQMGADYFKEKFGVTSSTAFNVDAFGHTRGMIQIMTKCGQDSMIVCRPLTGDREFEKNLFWWEGYDGSRIKVYRDPFGYRAPLGKAAETIMERVNGQKEDVVCVLWGVGNHGGGPSDKDLSDIMELQKNSEHQILHSTPEDYFAEVTPESTVNDSLWISNPGCYVSSICVKQKHLELENELYLAELMCALASAKGLMEYPKKELYTCAEDLLNGEFHDVLPGTSIQAGENNGLMYFNHGLLDANRIKTKAFFALCREQERAEEGEYPIVVFNPHPYTLKDNVECEFMLADQNWSETEHFEITVKNGDRTVPYQVIKEESNLNLDWRKRIIFEAELEPMSLNRYSVYLEKKPIVKKEEKEAFIFDNGHKYVEIDAETGLLKRYCLNGVEYVQQGFLLEMYQDNPDPWAMGQDQLKRLGTDGEPFVCADRPSGVFSGMKKVQVIEDGEIYLGIEAFFEKGNSKARIEYRIYKNNDDVDVNVTLFFNDINQIVKLALPVNGAEKLIGQTAYGTEILYMDGRENMSHRFNAVKTGEKYVALLDRSCYGGHFENGVLHRSLVRGTTYCAHPILDRELIPSDRFTKKMDQSEHNYHFRLTVCEEGELERKAMEFNRRPYAVNVFPLGNEKEEHPFEVKLSNTQIVLTAMKKSDRREGYLFRLINNSSEEKKTELMAGKDKMELTFGSYEVKTILYDGNLQELTQMEI